MCCYNPIHFYDCVPYQLSRCQPSEALCVPYQLSRCQPSAALCVPYQLSCCQPSAALCVPYQLSCCQPSATLCVPYQLSRYQPSAALCVPYQVDFSCQLTSSRSGNFCHGYIFYLVKAPVKPNSCCYCMSVLDMGWNIHVLLDELWWYFRQYSWTVHKFIPHWTNALCICIDTQR